MTTPAEACALIDECADDFHTLADKLADAEYRKTPRWIAMSKAMDKLARDPEFKSWQAVMQTKVDLLNKKVIR